MNSVIFVLTIIKRAVLGKHSEKCSAYLFRQVFLCERLHWGKKSAAKAFGGGTWGVCGDSIGVNSCRGQWQSRAMSLSAGVRQGQRMGKVGVCSKRSCSFYSPGHLSSTKISAVTFKDQVWSEDPQSCFSMTPPATLRESLSWSKGNPSLVLLNLTSCR